MYSNCSQSVGGFVYIDQERYFHGQLQRLCIYICVFSSRLWRNHCHPFPRCFHKDFIYICTWLYFHRLFTARWHGDGMFMQASFDKREKTQTRKVEEGERTTSHHPGPLQTPWCPPPPLHLPPLHLHPLPSGFLSSLPRHPSQRSPPPPHLQEWWAY